MRKEIGKRCIITLTQRRATQLNKTRFNGCGAGYFAHWASVKELLNEAVLTLQLEFVMQRVDEGPFQRTLDLNFEIGWASTLPVTDDIPFVSFLKLGWKDPALMNVIPFPSTDVESRHVGKTGRGLWVHQDCEEHWSWAPATSLVTRKGSVIHQQGNAVLKLYDIAPGRCPGKLRGDITKEKKIFFLHPGHLGRVILSPQGQFEYQQHQKELALPREEHNNR